MADIGKPCETHLLGIAFYKNESAQSILQWMIYEADRGEWIAGKKMINIPGNYENHLVNNRTYRVVKSRDDLCFVPVSRGRHIFIFNMLTYLWTCVQTSVPLTGIVSFGTHCDLFMIGGKADAENTTKHIGRLKFGGDQRPQVVGHMKAGRHSVGAGILDESLYAIGGANLRGEEGDTVERYQPCCKKVHVCKPLVVKRRHPGVGNLNGQLYCVGGSANETWTDAAERYDPSEDTWNAIAPMLYAFQSSNTSVVSFNGELVVAGSHGERTKIIAYIPEKNCWRKVPALPEPQTTNFQLLVLNENEYQAISHILTKNTCEIETLPQAELSLLESIFLELENRRWLDPLPGSLRQ